MESVKNTQTIDLVIKLEEWDRDKEYDRLGLEEEYIEFLGNKVVCHSLPDPPGTKSGGDRGVCGSQPQTEEDGIQCGKRAV